MTAFGLGVGGYVNQSLRRAAAEARAAQAQTERDAAERELRLSDLQRQCLAPHLEGWSSQTWKLVEQLAAGHQADRPVDYRLQQEAAACLLGYDVETVHEFTDFGARSAAFDVQGRLVLGGVTDATDAKKRLERGSGTAPRRLRLATSEWSATVPWAFGERFRSSSWSALPATRCRS